jgi:quinol monooxygenase YgiN
MDEPVGLVTLVAKEGREADLRALLGEMARHAATDDGCEIYAVHQSRREPRSFFLYERYRDKDAFKLHQANEELRELGAGLRDLTDSMEIVVGNLVVGDEIRR